MEACGLIFPVSALAQGFLCVGRALPLTVPGIALNRILEYGFVGATAPTSMMAEVL